MEFQTKRLICRPLLESDRDNYCALYMDKKIMRKIVAPFNREKSEQHFNSALIQNNSPSLTRLTWVIENKDSGQFIGVQGLQWLSPGDKQADLGIMIIPNANGKNIPREALTGVIEYAFDNIRLDAIRASFQPSHYASLRIVRRLGFVEQPIKKAALDKNVSLYVLSKEKWYNQTSTKKFN
ncbi:GNAT family N-acetyltransferase [Aliiglaciecola sp. CAU 1673]|uniref:GNAT family N-acetyltransferase n=1 Tax=Aliiglaciecola sp. CAU 1673 TaxID=3032595 RepID=UPI0023DB0028|nr:GNAT family N-acetyltransferase [Aliiglaciecola sp. CAU 1673]MDF2179409.1 GNAT family N-acetyltransferase [Aliiglaciecola sp. CAU 1673]